MSQNQLDRAMRSGADIAVVEGLYINVKKDEHKSKWGSDKALEYQELFPEFKEEETTNDEGETIIIKVPIDYSDDDSYLPFNDWMDERKTVTKTREITAEDGSESIEEYQDEEFVRPYLFDDSVLDFAPLRSEIQLKQLQKLYVQKYKAVQAIAIGKQGDDEYIQTQTDNYREMKKHADEGKFDATTTEAIIQANQVADARFNRISLAINEARAYVENKIKSGDDVSDALKILEAVGVAQMAQIKTNTTMQKAFEIMGLL